MNKPTIIKGGLVIDGRGGVGFVNDFDFAEVKRFYIVSNYKQGFVRAWHGHKKEGKYIFAVAGAALVGAVQINNWEKPSKDIKPEKYVISSDKPSILFIPAGYANGFMSLTPDCKVMFFSTSKLEESISDDFRYPSRYWDIWEVEEN